MAIRTFHPNHPLEGALATNVTPRPGAARRTAFRAGLAFVATLVVGSWAISNLEGVEWLARQGWPIVADVVAPAVALTVVAVAPTGTLPGQLATADRVSAGAGIVVVIGATVATWLWVGHLASLTPLLVGATALMVMKEALVERRIRAHYAARHHYGHL